MHIMWDLTQCVYIWDFNQCVYLPGRRVEEGRQAFLSGCWWQDKKHEPSRYVSIPSPPGSFPNSFFFATPCKYRFICHRQRKDEGKTAS